MKVVWAPAALREAYEAADYIAGERPGGAADWLDGLDGVVARLLEMPRSGRVFGLLNEPEVRETHYAGHRVIYRVDAECIRILRVVHTRRELRPEHFRRTG